MNGFVIALGDLAYWLSLLVCLSYPEMVAECESLGAGGRCARLALMEGSVADECRARDALSFAAMEVGPSGRTVVMFD
jgi:hypothetical protein